MAVIGMLWLHGIREKKLYLNYDSPQVIPGQNAAKGKKRRPPPVCSNRSHARKAASNVHHTPQCPRCGCAGLNMSEVIKIPRAEPGWWVITSAGAVCTTSVQRGRLCFCNSTIDAVVPRASFVNKAIKRARRRRREFCKQIFLLLLMFASLEWVFEVIPAHYQNSGARRECVQQEFNSGMQFFAAVPVDCCCVVVKIW